MNKKNKILVGCLALLLVLSVGYALFSETITINGTATAKGNFDIVLGCEKGISSIFGTSLPSGWKAEGGYENDTCTVSGNTVSMNSEFLYLGASRYYTLSFENKGTFDAIVNFSEAISTEQICVSDDDKGTNKRCVSEKRLEGYYGNFYAVYAGFPNATEKGVMLKDTSGNLISMQEAVAEGLYDITTQTLILKSGYTLYQVWSGTISFDWENDEYEAPNSMYVDYNKTVKFDFVQYTE